MFLKQNRNKNSIRYICYFVSNTMVLIWYLMLRFVLKTYKTNSIKIKCYIFLFCVFVQHLIKYDTSFILEIDMIIKKTILITHEKMHFFCCLSNVDQIKHKIKYNKNKNTNFNTVFTDAIHNKNLQNEQH